MLKKFFSLILAVLICFSALPYASATDSTSFADAPYDFAKEAASVVGVSFADGDAVSRIDFVAALVRACGMSGVKGDTMPYADVTDGAAGYEAIKTAYALSWISNATLFNPDNNITLVQALKMGVHAIGGEHQAAYWGGYPTGYLRLAQNADLLENIDAGNDAPLSVRDAYVLIYNILTSPTFETGFTGEGDISVSYGAPSILETQYDMYIYEGIVTANTITNLYNEAEIDRTTLKIDNKEFCDETGIFEYLGYNVYALCEKVNGKEYVRCISPAATNTVTLSNHDIDHVDGNIVYYGENGECKLKVSGAFVYVLNGKTTLLTNPDIAAIFDKDTAEFVFIDNNDDKTYDIVSAFEYTYTVVDRFDLYEGVIYDINSADSFVDISKDNFKCTVRAYEGGVYSGAKLSDIKSGMVIACAASADGTYADIILCHDSIKGSVDEKDSDGNVVIGGQTLGLSDYYSLYYVYNLGQQAQYMLGINDEIVAKASEKSSMKYAFVIDSMQKGGLDKSVYVKLFDQSDAILTIAVAKKTILDGEPKTSDDIHAFVEALSTDADRFVRYSVNGEGEINCIDTHENKINEVESYGADGVENNSLALHFDGNYQPRGSNLFLDASGAAKFNWKGTEYIFVLPKEADRDDEELYRIADASEIKTNGSEYKIDVLGFDTDAAGSAKAIVVYGGYLQSVNDIKKISIYGVVESVTRAIDQDGDNGYKLRICDVSGHQTIYLPSDVANEYFVPAEGDIIGCILKEGDMVSYIIRCFDFKTYTVDTNYATESADNAIMTGMVYSMSGGYMHYLPAYMKTPYIPTCPQTIDFSQMRNSNITAQKTVYIDAVRSLDGSVVHSVNVNANPDAKLRTIKTSGKENASFVVNRLSYGNSQVAFVYSISYK